MTNKKINKSWYFLIAILLVYLFLFLFNRNSFINSGNFFINILQTIIPSFILVFILLVVVNYFVTPQFIIKHFGDKSIKKWFFVIIGAIISSGPPFIWYPLLKEAKEKGVSYGLIACFIYSRSIKIPYIPLMIFYFGIKYTLILVPLIIIMSVVQGIMIDKIMEKK